MFIVAQSGTEVDGLKKADMPLCRKTAELCQPFFDRDVAEKTLL